MISVISLIAIFFIIYLVMTRKNIFLMFLGFESIIGIATINFILNNPFNLSYSLIIFAWAIAIAETIIMIAILKNYK